jgi:hypothetical protein
MESIVQLARNFHSERHSPIDLMGVGLGQPAFHSVVARSNKRSISESGTHYQTALHKICEQVYWPKSSRQEFLRG